MDVLKGLEAFVTVARAGGFSAAAKRLGVATSIVTKRVEQLEAHVQCRLFYRTTRHVRLTEIGTTWLEKAEAASGSLQDVLSGMGGGHLELEGRIRVKAPTTLTLFYLTPIFFAFQARHPKVSLDLVLNDRLISPYEGDFDVVLAGIPGAFGDTTERALCTSRLIVCAAPEYLRTREAITKPLDLQTHQLLSFSPIGTCWNFYNNEVIESVEIVPTLSANDGQVVLAAALAGRGVALLARYTVTPSLRDGKLVPLLQSFGLQHHVLRAIVPTSKVSLPRVAGLIAHLRDALQPEPPWEIALT